MLILQLSPITYKKLRFQAIAEVIGVAIDLILTSMLELAGRASAVVFMESTRVVSQIYLWPSSWYELCHIDLV